MEAGKLQGAIESGRQVLSKAGILAAPVRDLADATRSLTVGRPIDEVRAVWSDPTCRGLALRAGTAEGPLAAPGTPPAAVASGDRISFDLPDGGRGVVELKVAPQGLGTEVRCTIHVGELSHEGRPRYGTGAPVIALRALHGAKALLETGEAPTLAANPAGRDHPDPYATPVAAVDPGATDTETEESQS